MRLKIGWWSVQECGVDVVVRFWYSMSMRLKIVRVVGKISKELMAGFPLDYYSVLPKSSSLLRTEDAGKDQGSKHSTIQIARVGSWENGYCASPRGPGVVVYWKCVKEVASVLIAWQKQAPLLTNSPIGRVRVAKLTRQSECDRGKVRKMSIRDSVNSYSTKASWN